MPRHVVLFPIERRIFVLASFVALFGIASGSVCAAADSEPPVLAKDINSPRVPGKVAAILWTVRAERCTLQVVFPNAGRIAQAMQDDPNLKPGRPSVQVWLLKADGTLIAPIGRIDPGAATAGKNSRQPYGVEILFAFPLSSDKDAVAAAIRIDDAFYIEPLKTLVKEHP